MSLTWDASKVAESVRKGTRYDDQNEPYEGLSLVTEALIFASLATGIGTITEANAPEVFARLSIIERSNGALRGNQDGPVFFTAQEVIDHIGLKTNASYTDETRAKWLKRIVGQDMDGFARQVAQAQAARKAVEAPVAG